MRYQILEIHKINLQKDLILHKNLLLNYISITARKNVNLIHT